MEFLTELTGITGVSGHERPVRRYLREHISDVVDEVKTDALGNLVAHQHSDDSGAIRVMIAAHMDEVGIMARKVDDEGFVRFLTLGSLRPQILLGQRVRFTSGTAGIISSERLDESEELKLKHLYVDIGTSSREETLEAISLGETASFLSQFSAESDRITAKALDDRIGCAIMVECMRKLEGRAPDHELCWVFTSQEEVGVRGAQVAAQVSRPHLAIVVDVTPAGDTPKGLDYDTALGSGACIKVMDQIPPMGGFIAPPGVTEFLVNLAEERNIPWQYDILERGSTDAASVHLTGEGVLCAVISVPIRYSHSPHEMVSMTDVEAARDLILGVLEELDADALNRMME
ncbi:MAG: M42 family metallopeptidase [Bacillota bacterium]